MSKGAALSVVVACALLIGAVGGVVLMRMVSPVLAFADETDAQSIHGDVNSTPSASATANPGAGATVAASAPVTPGPVVTPAVKPDACSLNRNKQHVIVQLQTQHAWFCKGNKTVFETAITSGMAKPHSKTPKGTFTVRAKVRNTVLTPDTGEHFRVKYWIAFSGTEYGFHDAAWQKVPYGSQKYRAAGSHGCVHLPLKAAKFLYAWVKVGAKVTIA